MYKRFRKDLLKMSLPCQIDELNYIQIREQQKKHSERLTLEVCSYQNQTLNLNRVTCKLLTKQKNMSKKIQVNSVNAKLFTNIESQLKTKGNQMFSLHLIQGEIAKNDLDFFKTDAGKQYADGLPNKPTKIEDIIKQVYGCTKQHFYRLKQLFEIPSDVREQYEKQETSGKTLEKCLTFARNLSKGTDSEADSEADVKKETESLKISVKQGKISIKGTAEISEIDLLISELQRMKAEKSQKKAA